MCLGPKKKGWCPKIVFENKKKGLNEGACGFFDLYRPTPKEVKKACKPKERIHHGSKGRFSSDMK
jgi:hypothetical protein